MLVAGFAAGPWGTNCWVMATGPGQECLVVDPGMDSLPQLQEILSEQRLKPVAVLLTHGHMDHMWSVTPCADGYGIPAYIHSADRRLLANPELGVSAQAAEMIRAMGGEFVEPASVVELTGDTQLSLAGLSLLAQPAPGHTPGSVAFTVAADLPRMFSGDLLFRGSVGRTDLPGGSPADMAESLRRVVGGADPHTLVHCGHGPDTSVADELAGNPFLADLRGGRNG